MQTTYSKPMHSNNVEKILFLDIETVGIQPYYEDLEPWLQYYWSIKCHQIRKWKTDTDYKSDIELYETNAGIYAEFGKIVSIGLSYFSKSGESMNQINSTSLFDICERKLLLFFKNLLEESFNSGIVFIAGHNIKEFDIPFLCRRMLINNIELPDILDVRGKKSWEIKHFLDTMNLWKFGDYKHYTSLDILTRLFDLPSPKLDINGSDIHNLFWIQKDYEKIRQYCEKDSVMTLYLYCKMIGKNLGQEVKHISKNLYG